ncbi:maleylpyruvate isomerase family mycothiol-dependent enzyme [Nocardioides anomalus]|uniref:Maleylpyruvate isomerase family mycothiol-dependent enzyme n=1 Tax=Nocardioides anomalus TaxID=2712223 RepID=A0A6G6WDA0_9ACTN|nr:maleylpyruvate isomerase family mycothiol-dependent enzyme [Nocardioides anomalus]QIG43075.1 maleylpyruvate isomerase family mycothiol-dependent enzyme [Nocardioides anomalus]
MADAQLLELLDSGTRRLVRSVDGLTDEQWSEPSLLPGWTRAHVVAHLTLNAEALGAALEGVHEGRAVPMYASDEARDAEIVALAEQEPSTIRDRFYASSTVLGEWVEELADNLAGATVERTPGGRTFTAGQVGTMRTREVEIHHADLGLDYTAADWPPAFAALVLATRAADHPPGPGPVAHAVDLDQRFVFGDGSGPTVSGPGSALAWWVTGRGPGEGLTSDDGQVPRMEPW